jgi:hypothetical protein
MEGNELPKLKSCSERFSDIICKACAYRPEDRYQDITQFENALAEYIKGGNTSFTKGNSFAKEIEDKNITHKKKGFKLLPLVVTFAAVFAVITIFKLNGSDTAVVSDIVI